MDKMQYLYNYNILFTLNYFTLNIYNWISFSSSSALCGRRVRRNPIRTRSYEMIVHRLKT